jgi:hypothetical protein
MKRSPISRRVALAAASVLVLALSACGDPSSSSGTVPGTLPVIRVAGSGAGGAEGALAADASASMSSKMMPSNLTYVFDGQIPDLTSPAASWVFRVGERASDDAFRALAAALGVSGDVVVQPADMGGGRMIGSTDYTGPSVYLGDDALSSWWFNGNQAGSFGGCAVAEPMPAESGDAESGDAGSSGDVTSSDATLSVPDPAPPTTLVDPMPCEDVQPPTGVPTKDEAEAKARQLLTALGVDPASYQFDTYADEWNASVTGYLVLDGVRTTVSMSVGYGAEGSLVWASGFLATPQRSADYPRIGVEAAVERLNDQQASMLRGWGPAPADATIEPAPAEPMADAPDSVEPVVPTTCVDDAATTCVSIAPTEFPVDMPVAMQPIVITLTDPQPTLEQLWDVDGTVWLVPGYSFTSADGGVWSVTAIGDEYLQLDDAAVDQPVTVDTATGDSVVEPVTVPSAVTGDNAWDLNPSGPLNVEQATAALVGRSLDEVATIPWTVRVVRKDGVDLAATADFQPQRVNVVVENGTVTEVQGIG